MDVIQQLKNDHNQLKKVMEDLETVASSNTGSDKEEELYHQFKDLFTLHDKIEDDLIYPALEKHSALKNLVEKARQAHHMVHVGLLELKLLPYSSNSWGPKFSVIKDSIVTHIKEEEEVLLAQASKTMDSHDLEDLNKQMNEMKKEAG